MVMQDDVVAAVDYAALADFRHALREFLVFSERRAAEHGLTAQQHQALLAIRGAPTGQVTIGYLAERLVIKPHSASGLIDRLELLGFVAKSASREDRRQALIELTQRALDLLEKLSATHQEELRRLRPMFTSLLTRLD
jgi:DNA-binding MarR family transcriptional regulator